MYNQGTRAVMLLKDRGPYKAGETVQADVWLNLDAYEPCAEVKVPGKETVLLGRLCDGGWQYANEKSGS